MDLVQSAEASPAGDLALAARAARAGGAAAMPFYGSTEAVLKDGGSPVTAADHASNDAVLAILRAERPADAILSEESRDSHERLAAERVWIVDPLDGTREFISQNGEFAVMVGLAVGGRSVLGAVYLPAVDVLYLGAEGLGSVMETAAGREPLRCAEAPEGAPRLVGSRSHPDPLLVRMQESLGITDVRPSGSVGVKCGLIATTERDLYIHPVPYLKEWDTCAPEAILVAAGGTVTDCVGQPLRYNKVDPAQPDGILAAAPGVAERVGAQVTELYQQAKR